MQKKSESFLANCYLY